MQHCTPQLKGVKDAIGSRSAVVVCIVAVMPLWYAVVRRCAVAVFIYTGVFARLRASPTASS